MPIHKKIFTVLAFTVLSLTWGCGQAVVNSKLKTLNKKYNDRLIFEKIHIKAIKFGDPYKDQLKAKGGTSPYKYIMIEGKLPEGLVLDESSGEIAGTPVKKGDNPIVIILKDSSGKSNNYLVQSFSL